ncbi:MAG: glycosyltransferase family 4 protein [Odoribacter sp.]
MKIIYVIPQFVGIGGKERVLANKVNYISEHWNAEIIIITSEQKPDAPNSFDLSEKIRLIHLDIEYDKYKKKNPLLNRLAQKRCVSMHRNALEKIFLQEKPDVVVSMFAREMTWLYKIKDGSKKILEFHFNKDSLKITAKSNLILWLKYWEKKRAVKHYDKFVVLTEEDKKDWGDRKNLWVIPNALTFYPSEQSNMKLKRVLSVGRLISQKGFDRLLDIWRKVEPFFPEWTLSIVGSGIEQKHLEQQIIETKLQHIELLPATSNILQEYLQSSIYVLTSRYEGFPMVLHEAMSCGVPVVSYACKCGPRDIIRNEEDGFLIEDGNREEFVCRLSQLMENEKLRQDMGKMARQNIVRFSEEQVMKQWKLLFDSLFT